MCVVSLHTVEGTVPLTRGIGAESATWMQILLFALVEGVSQLGVPLFLIITGYLMLHRRFNLSYLQTYWHRNLLPMLVAYEIWNAVLALNEFYVKHTFSLGAFLKASLFLGKPSMSHMWFMQMIIGVYIVLPLLAWIIAKAEENLAISFVGFVVGVITLFQIFIPSVAEFMSLIGFNISLIPEIKLTGNRPYIIICLFAGYCLRRYVETIRKWRHICISLMVILLCVQVFVMSIWFRHLPHGTTFSFGYDFATTIMLAILVSAVCIRPYIHGTTDLSRYFRVLVFLSSSVFGIYITHEIVLQRFFLVQSQVRILAIMPEFGRYALFLSFSLLLSLLIVCLLSRSSWLKHWLLLMK